MKSKIERYLCNAPRLYASLLRLLGSSNDEKIFYLNHVRKGDIIFELGANRGYFTQIFSNIAGSNGQVHAFEAVPPTFEILNANCNTCIRNNLHLNNLAVGNKEEFVQMNMPMGDDGQASLKTHSSGAWQNAEIKQFETKMIRLDEYVSENNINHVNFVKCDIEGAELLAFQGFEKSLKRYKPGLFIEMYSPWFTSFNYKPKDLLDFLMHIGYSEFCTVNDSIKPLKPHENFEKKPENIYCI